MTSAERSHDPVPPSRPNEKRRYSWLGALGGSRWRSRGGPIFARVGAQRAEVSVCDRRHGWQTRRRLASAGRIQGVVDGFVPVPGVGTHYKDGVRSKNGKIIGQSDPYSFSAEHIHRPTASIITTSINIRWKTTIVMCRRAKSIGLQQRSGVNERAFVIDGNDRGRTSLPHLSRTRADARRLR